ncbi:DUF6247 family protein [Streptomyces sp. NPDC048603]|uniref:DUF6247 family protein n=1 Tax=Streptomyces sp. NPDC048603 TaxID=3365577 RepID=UPI0037113B6F
MTTAADPTPRQPSPLPLRTLGDIRAALRDGHGFPGDRDNFEAALTRALEASDETDLQAVAEVIVDYRGRIRLRSDPAFEAALAEGLELTRTMKGRS